MPLCSIQSLHTLHPSTKPHLGINRTKPVFGVSDKVRFKLACSATETRWKIELSLVARLDMILSNKQITKALIRLRGCAGWSDPFLLANHRRQVFSRHNPFDSGPLLYANCPTSIRSREIMVIENILDKLPHSY